MRCWRCWPTAIALTLILAGPVACTRTNWPKATRTAAPPVPAYPSVRSGPTETLVQTKRVTTFVTDDPAESVHAFYRTQLPQAGWTLARGFSRSALSGFDNQQACPINTFDMVTRPHAAQGTAVELHLRAEDCVDR